MPHNRFFHSDLNPAEITITGDEHSHLFKVMRAHEGSVLELIDGKGTLAHGTVLAIDKKSAQIALSKKQHHNPPPETTLAQSFIKQPKLELVIEKCTELGITDFHLFPAEKSERDHLSDNNLQRLHNIIIAATKQCGRLYLPTLHIHSKVPILKDAAYATLKGNPPHLLNTHVKRLYIGPEAGWSAHEEKQLQATPVTLHPLTLRAETAAIVACSYLTACL
ncbi:MAG: 16S rRNA (uracil(1498)-N(3))-methyltransferase [Chlamydiales bacterium]|nr:16S rRNA (uracil(1498)-N(3))-methyltransferase [Chlamydiales bacterium]